MQGQLFNATANVSDQLSLVKGGKRSVCHDKPDSG